MKQILRAIADWLCRHNRHWLRQDPWPALDDTLEGLAWACDGKRTATCRWCGARFVKYSGYR